MSNRIDDTPVTQNTQKSKKASNPLKKRFNAAIDHLILYHSRVLATRKAKAVGKPNDQAMIDKFTQEIYQHIQDLLMPFENDDMPAVLTFLANYVKDGDFKLIDSAAKAYIQDQLPKAARPFAKAFFSIAKFIFMKTIVDSPEMQKKLSPESIAKANATINAALDVVMDDLVETYEGSYKAHISKSEVKNMLKDIQDVVSDGGKNNDHYALILFNMLASNSNVQLSPLTSEQKFKIQDIIGEKVEAIICNKLAAGDENKKEQYLSQLGHMTEALDDHSPAMILFGRILQHDNGKKTLHTTLESFSDNPMIKAILNATGDMIIAEMQTPTTYDENKMEAAVENIITDFISGFGSTALNTMLIDTTKVEEESKSSSLGFGLLAGLFNHALTLDSLENTLDKVMSKKSPYYDFAKEAVLEVQSLIQSVSEDARYDNLNPTATNLLTGLVKQNVDAQNANNDLRNLTQVTLSDNKMAVTQAAAYSIFRGIKGLLGL